MKGKNIGRAWKALAVSLAIGLGVTACSRDYTVGYLYVANAKALAGLITAYSIDYQSGSLTQLADSPIPAGGNNTVAVIVSPNQQNLYVLNHDTSTVVEYDIGTDGKIYPENTYNVVQGANLTGSFPTAEAVDAAGKFLYVTFTYQNGYTTVAPGPGGIATFPINADGSLAPALTNTTNGVTLPYVPLGNNPVGLVVSSVQSGGIGHVYAIDDDTSTGGTASGVLVSFAENTTTGALSQIASNLLSTTAPTTPRGITEDPAGRFLYVTDTLGNGIFGYTIGASGVPTAMSAPLNPFNTQLNPAGLKVDPRGLFLYVANYGSNSVGTYTINQTNGTLTTLQSAENVATGSGPTCITIDPALGIYLYTSNSLDNTISAEQLNPTTGQLSQVQGTKFSTQVLPTCLVAVANGAHATQIVQ